MTKFIIISASESSAAFGIYNHLRRGSAWPRPATGPLPFSSASVILCLVPIPEICLLVGLSAGMVCFHKDTYYCGQILRSVSSICRISELYLQSPKQYPNEKEGGVHARGRYLPLLIASLPPSCSVSSSGQNQPSVKCPTCCLLLCVAVQCGECMSNTAKPRVSHWDNSDTRNTPKLCFYFYFQT